MTEEEVPMRVDVRGLEGIWAAEWHWENVEGLELVGPAPSRTRPTPTLVVELTQLHGTNQPQAT